MGPTHLEQVVGPSRQEGQRASPLGHIHIQLIHNYIPTSSRLSALPARKANEQAAVAMTSVVRPALMLVKSGEDWIWGRVNKWRSGGA